jgi:hypothetical protein
MIRGRPRTIARMTSDPGEVALDAKPTVVAPADSRLSRLGPGRALDLVTGSLVAVQGLALFLLVARGGWLADDFVNLSMAQRSSLSKHYLRQLVFEHPEPGVRLLNWTLMRVAPTNRAFFALVSVACIALTSWVIYRILLLVFRPSLAMTMLAWLAGAVVLWLPSSMWWASTMELAPCVLGSALACHATVRCYLGSRRVLWGIAAGVWLLLALSFYERALVGAAVSLMFLPLAVCDKIRPRQVLAVVWRAWPAYAAIVLVTAAYVAFYLHGDYVHANGGYTVDDMVALFWHSWGYALVPGLLGGPFHWWLVAHAYPVPHTPAWWIAIGQVVALVVLVAGVRRLGWRSVRGWVMFVPLFFGGMAAVASARLATYGPGVGNEYRYVVDLVPMTALALGLVLLRPRQDDIAPSTETAARATPRLFDRRAVLLAGGFLLVTAPLIATSAIPASNDWAANPTKAYLANLSRSLTDAARGGRWSVYNTNAPTWVIHYTPYNSMEYLGQFATDRNVPVNQPDSRQFEVTSQGIALPAAFHTASTAPGRCTTQPNEAVVLPLRPPVGLTRWFLTLRYTTTGKSALSFATNSGSGFVDADGTYKAYPAQGSGSLILGLRRRPIAQLRIKAAAPGTCFTDVRIGVPVPAGT